MSDFQRGEIVDVTIKGVRIEDQYPDGSVRIEADTFSGAYGTWHMPPQAKVERVAPAEWPPQPGDLWRDQDGDLWYGLIVDDDDTEDESYVVLRPGRTSKHPSYVNSDNDGIRRTYGPLTLVYREEQQSGGAE